MAGLEAKTRPRAITPEQSQAIIALLKESPKGPVKVKANWLNAEAVSFANDISSVLMAGGFETVKEDLHMLNADLFGVIMFVRNLTNAPIHASAIQKAFKRNGIEINSASVFGTGKEIEGFLTKDPNRVVIWVAQKP